jgi:hypothetical protein
MPEVKVGDRIRVASRKVGTPPRVGTVTALNGSFLTVRWEGGTESSFAPAAGSISLEEEAERTATISGGRL